MSETVQFSVQGLEGIEMKLKAVSEDVRFRGGRFALRKAAVALAEIIKANARSIDNAATPRSIPLNVAVRFNRRLFDSTGNIGMRVGILGGAGGNAPTESLASNPGGDTRYWRHVEFGTSKMAAQPFMRRALADNTGELIGIFVTNYQSALTRAIKRANKS